MSTTSKAPRLTRLEEAIEDAADAGRRSPEATLRRCEILAELCRRAGLPFSAHDLGMHARGTPPRRMGRYPGEPGDAYTLATTERWAREVAMEWIHAKEPCDVPSPDRMRALRALVAAINDASTGEEGGPP